MMTSQTKPPLSPLVDKYLAQWKKDPKGHAFAPLAEAYRRSGLQKEAMQTLARGLKVHPNYLLGHLVMAECFSDEDKWEEVYKILRPFAQIHFDNLKLQLLFAQAAYKNYSMTEALQSYKCVLFLDPNNQEVRLRIRELEENEKNYYAYLNKEIPLRVKQQVSFPSSSSLDSEQHDSGSEWSMLGGVKFDEEFLENTEDEYSDWSVRKDNISLNPQDGLPDVIAPYQKEKNFSETSPIDINPPETFQVIEGELPEVIDPEVQEKIFKNPLDAVVGRSNLYDEIQEGEEIPIVTHTLIDLYFAQKHYEKAKELLLKVLKHDPKDERSRDKLKKIEHITGKTIEIPPVKISISASERPERSDRSEKSVKSITEDDFQGLSESYGQYLKELKKHFWKK